MSQKNTQIWFFVILTVALFILSYYIFKPYLGIIFLSVILSIVFMPFYEKLLSKFNGSQIIASLSTVFIIFICIIVPLILLSGSLLKEAVDLYNYLAFGGTNKIIQNVNNFLSHFSYLFPGRDFSPYLVVDNYVRNIFNWIVGHFDSIFTAIFGGLLNFILMLLSLYYLLINGKAIKKNLISWQLLPGNFTEEVLNALNNSINAVVRGRLLVSIAQGLFVSAGFFIFNVPNPILWGFVATIASLVPIIGTSVVTIPAIAYLWVSGSMSGSIGLFVWSVLGVGLVDNVLSFFFLKGRISVHPLIILFSILGGVEVFGPMGFLVGPIVTSALITLMKIYPQILSFEIQRKQ